jgi:DNA gyrase/topoisomerase IV subunit B
MYFPHSNSKLKIKFDVTKAGKLKESYTFKPKEFDKMLDTRLDESKMIAPKIVLSCNDSIKEMITEVTPDGASILDKKEVSKNIKLDIVLTYTDDIGASYDTYCNYTHTIKGGIHQEAVDKVFCNYMQNKVKNSMSESQKNKYPVIWDDVRSGLYCVILLTTDAQVNFVGNAKEEIQSKHLLPVLVDMVSKEVDKYFTSHPQVFDTYSKIIKSNAKGRIEANAVRKATATERMNNLKEHEMRNYIPCINRGPNDFKELFICEGDSASGSIRDASDPYTQAIFLMRGVTSNAFKWSIAKLMENRELSSLITILRCGVGKNFDINKLYFDRINIFSDEDVDGFNISSILLAFFYVCLPDVVRAGKLFKVFSPLYKLDEKDNEFVINKHEMVEIYFKKIAKLYKIRIGKGEWFDKKLTNQFLEDTYDYADSLERVVTSAGKTNKVLMEAVLAQFVLSSAKYINLKKRERIDIDALLDNQKFVTDFMGKLSKRFKEITLDGNKVSAIIDKKMYQVRLSSGLIHKAVDMIQIYNKYGYIISVKNKKTDEERTMSISEFIDMCSTIYPHILHRFKGLGEINDSDLRKYSMDINNRVSVQYTMASLEDDIKRAYENEIMNVVHSQSGSYPNKRKEMIRDYNIRRDDIDN